VGRPRKTPASTLSEIHVYVDEERWARVKKISEQTGVPASELVRQALDTVLDIAEKQMDTLEKLQVKPC